ncbi:hypothetical protein AAGV33_03135 [Flavobacterium sp. FBOR7N2.3]|uniref:Uncharacterized protein n=1 Tax=Flavobacterium magnesitis TaxID=3138077 RepID=A0ABV4TH03_9FLAO
MKSSNTEYFFDIYMLENKKLIEKEWKNLEGNTIKSIMNKKSRKYG